MSESQPQIKVVNTHLKLLTFGVVSAVVPMGLQRDPQPLERQSSHRVLIGSGQKHKEGSPHPISYSVVMRGPLLLGDRGESALPLRPPQPGSEHTLGPGPGASGKVLAGGRVHSGCW